MPDPSLDARRKVLVERCAEQRSVLAVQFRAFEPKALLAEHPALKYVATHKTLVLGVLGVGVGIALFGRKRLAGMAGTTGVVLRNWNTVRGLPGMLKAGGR